MLLGGLAKSTGKGLSTGFRKYRCWEGAAACSGPGDISVGKGHGTAASSTDPEGLFRWKACCLSYIRGSPVS